VVNLVKEDLIQRDMIVWVEQKSINVLVILREK